ncbi:MAG: UDP-glucose--hexose-1-phosphate uridylyltransferase [Candidatus Eremiobacteraeota bacterium]|nr:UDP-glucose--hexose-1-phosphate uridylyltransferase [Candidatus Eremiobacteraeota bacterium]
MVTLRRYNPLTREWVLVSPHRSDRPWRGERVAVAPARVARYDPECYLCPNNVRANGERNPRYETTYVFDNDFPAIAGDSVPKRAQGDTLLVEQTVGGVCRVLCFSPRHDLHLASMGEGDILAVVDSWASQYDELSRLPFVNAVTIFENRGAMMGASNPHPHGQIWAESSIPNELAKESASFEAYEREHDVCLLCAYLALESERGERIVYADEHALAVVPFWAVWPYEVLLAGRSHRGALVDLLASERASLARAMRDVTARYDRLFGVPFPYSMGFHQRPSDGGSHETWHAHAHYYPPLLRSESVRKYMVGYEMLAQPQRDFTPERAAQELRDA